MISMKKSPPSCGSDGGGGVPGKPGAPGCGGRGGGVGGRGGDGGDGAPVITGCRSTPVDNACKLYLCSFSVQ